MQSICKRHVIYWQTFMHRKLWLQSVTKPNMFTSCSPRRSIWTSNSSQNMSYLIRIPPIFGILLLAVIIHRRNNKKLQEKLAEFYQIQLPPELFRSNISLYKYKNYVFPSRILLFEDFASLKDFEFRGSDIIVASFPKAGITWVQEIVYMLCHNCQPSDNKSAVMETRFPYLEYPYPGIKSVEKMDGQRLIKTHLPFSLLPDSFDVAKPKLIYVVRNPRDVAVSYFHFMKLLMESSFIGSFAQFVDLFTSDKVPYSPLGDHIRSYSEKSNCDNILFVSYEDLKDDPIEAITAIATFLQIDVDSNDIMKVANATTFSSMKANPSVNYEHWKEYGFAHRDGHFLRKGEIGDWKNYFDPEMLAKFTEWEKLQNFPVQFKYQP